MPDIDVAAVALASPPPSAPQATYTPAVTVKNNGIHARAATGYLQMFDKATGVLLDTFPLASASIAAGATGLAYATGVLDLSAAPVGKVLMFCGFVSCTGDQVPANNVLAPCFVTVSAEPPEPPGPVVSHASQHEEGGNDELYLEGLRGKLASKQEPTEHASNHEAGGEDPLSVEGLPGQLLEPQATANHDNTRHTTPFATAAELQGHALATTAHADASNLEKSANKNVASGYCGLDGTGYVDPDQLGTRPQHGINFLSDKFVFRTPAAPISVGGPDNTLIHSGNYAEISGSYKVESGNRNPFCVHARAAAVILGADRLDLFVSVHVRTPNNLVTIVSRSFTCAENSSQDSVIIDAEASFVWNAQTGHFEMGASGFILYPAGGVYPDQIRASGFEPSAVEFDETATVTVRIEVNNGDPQNGCYFYHGSIERRPLLV